MNKIQNLVVSVLAVVVCATFAQATTDEEYFDQHFEALQTSIAGVKGDTTEILGILGTVFEGVVPSGSTVQKMLDKNGWSMPVFMGHNNLANPDKVAANTQFTYPKTAAEFDAAMKKGKPMYYKWLKTRDITFRVNRIKADTVDIDRLNIRVARVTEKLVVKDFEIDALTVRVAKITEELTVKRAEINDLRIKNAEIDHLKVRLAELDTLSVRLLTVNEALIEKLRIKSLEVGEAVQRAKIAEAKPPVIKTQTVYKNLVGVGYMAPGSMTIVQSGSACDERAFRGNVPKAVLEATNGQPADVLELHRRTGKDMEYKVKRLHVDSNGVAYPLQWDNGQCVRMYSDRPLVESDFRSLMTTGETLVPTAMSEIGAKSFGTNMTEGVYILYSAHQQ